MLGPIRALFGHYSDPSMERRYWVMRRHLWSDRVFLVIDLLLSVAVIGGYLMNAIMPGLIPLVMLRIARIVLVARMLLHFPAGARVPFSHYSLFVMLAVLDAVVLTGLVEHSGQYSQTLMVTLLTLGTVLFPYPTRACSRFIGALVLTANWAYWAVNGPYSIAALTVPQELLTGSIYITGVIFIAAILERQRRELVMARFDAQRSLRHKNYELKRTNSTLNEYAQQLVDAKERNQEAYQVNLARAVLHGLAQPISAATHFVHRLGKQTQVCPDTHDTVRQLENTLEQARNQVHGIRALMGTQREHQTTTCQFNRALDDALALVNPLDKQRIALKVNQRVDISVGLHPSILTQTLAVLINNAVHANPTGQLNIAIRCVGHSADRLKLMFSNDGQPIDSAIARQLFKSPIQSGTHGYGIGLFVIAKLLEENSANIRLSSSSPPGFELNLPLAG